MILSLAELISRTCLTRCTRWCCSALPQTYCRARIDVRNMISLQSADKNIEYSPNPDPNIHRIIPMKACSGGGERRAMVACISQFWAGPPRYPASIHLAAAQYSPVSSPYQTPTYTCQLKPSIPQYPSQTQPSHVPASPSSVSRSIPSIPQYLNHPQYPN